MNHSWTSKGNVNRNPSHGQQRNPAPSRFQKTRAHRTTGHDMYDKPAGNRSPYEGFRRASKGKRYPYSHKSPITPKQKQNGRMTNMFLNDAPLSPANQRSTYRPHYRKPVENYSRFEHNRGTRRSRSQSHSSTRQNYSGEESLNRNCRNYESESKLPSKRVLDYCDDNQSPRKLRKYNHSSHFEPVPEKRFAHEQNPNPTEVRRVSSKRKFEYNHSSHRGERHSVADQYETSRNSWEARKKQRGFYNGSRNTIYVNKSPLETGVTRAKRYPEKELGRVVIRETSNSGERTANTDKRRWSEKNHNPGTVRMAAKLHHLNHEKDDEGDNFTTTVTKETSPVIREKREVKKQVDKVQPVNCNPDEAVRQTAPESICTKKQEVPSKPSNVERMYKKSKKEIIEKVGVADHDDDVISERCETSSKRFTKHFKSNTFAVEQVRFEAAGSRGQISDIAAMSKVGSQMIAWLYSSENMFYDVFGKKERFKSRAVLLAAFGKGRKTCSEYKKYEGKADFESVFSSDKVVCWITICGLEWKRLISEEKEFPMRQVAEAAFGFVSSEVVSSLSSSNDNVEKDKREMDWNENTWLEVARKQAWEEVGAEQEATKED
ncbi:hypothetical protein FGB62_250g09 [Gracilaria domingensis]|nr:hypothetical protein FGB62_250g09 [Gracilaria domingensis]